MKRFVSDIDRIMALIYEDQPLPPPVPKEQKPPFGRNDPLFPAKVRTGSRRRPEKMPSLHHVTERRKPQLQLDFSSLDQIRSDAEETMNKLITEEEQAELLPAEPEPAVFPDGTAEAVCGLDPVEMQLLLKLLKDGDVSGFQTSGRLLSVLIDQINEKLFDEFADTVIENGPRPRIIPDYEEDLKEMFLQVMR